MSKSSVISGNTIDMGLLRTVMKDDMAVLLKEVQISEYVTR